MIGIDRESFFLRLLTIDRKLCVYVSISHKRSHLGFIQGISGRHSSNQDSNCLQKVFFYSNSDQAFLADDIIIKTPNYLKSVPSVVFLKVLASDVSLISLFGVNSSKFLFLFFEVQT